MKPIHVAIYDGYTREGTSTDVRAVHIGGERWFLELYKAGFYLRFGDAAFSCGFEWTE